MIVAVVVHQNEVGKTYLTGANHQEGKLVILASNAVMDFFMDEPGVDTYHLDDAPPEGVTFEDIILRGIKTSNKRGVLNHG